MNLRVLALGAGVQSTALALMIEKGEFEKVDCAIFDDTGSVHETFDTLQEAEIARENFVLQAWEDMLQ